MSRDSPGNGLAGDPGLKLRMRGEERRISSQHQQLEELFERVLASVRRGGPRKGVSDFLLFATALEAHMSVEEDIYFPALHGLRGDIGGELESLMGDHVRFRRRLEEVREILATNDPSASRRALDELAADVDQHEEAEEALIARITEGPVESTQSSSLDL